MSSNKRSRPAKRRIERIRHKHDSTRIAGLRAKMEADGTVALEVDKVFADLGQLQDYTFLEELSVRGLKRGAKAIGELKGLLKLSLWAIRDLDIEWIRGLQRLEYLFCHGIKFNPFFLPATPSALQYLQLVQCNGFGDELNLSSVENLEYLTVRECGHISRISDCSHLKKLKIVSISNIRDLNTLHGISSAPNLRTVLIQMTPNLSVNDLEWMLEHPTLEQVYPALEVDEGAPILDDIRALLAPRFGEDLFEREIC